MSDVHTTYYYNNSCVPRRPDPCHHKPKSSNGTIQHKQISKALSLNLIPRKYKMSNKEVAAIRKALSDRMNNVEKTPQKRSLGTVVLFPTAFQCPWADRLCRGEICDDGVTINTEDGDTFESVFHWVQAEQRREMMAIVKQSQQERAQEEKEQEGQKVLNAWYPCAIWLFERKY